MDMSSILPLSGVTDSTGVSSAASISSSTVAKMNEILGKSAELTGTAESSDMFSSMLQAAIDNIGQTNDLLSAAENEEIKWALGESENTHQLTIALQKASTALQYTVAVRDKFLEAYKEIMQMQI